MTITDRLVSKTAQEGSAIPFTVKTYTDSAEPWTLVTPTSVRYRLDDEDGCEVVAWTTATAASSQTITLTGTQTTLNSCERKRMKLVVEADHGLSTACVATRDFWVAALAGVSA